MSETNEPIDEVVSQEMRRAGFGSEQDGYKVITVELLEAILARQLEQVREIVRAETTRALYEAGLDQVRATEEPAAPTDPARITYTEEARAYFDRYPLVLNGRQIDVLEWAKPFADAVGFARMYDRRSELTWHDKAFYDLIAEGHAEATAESYAGFWYLWSLAGDHPDYNNCPTAAYTVRQARERAIEEQREKQGGNPA